jgi:polar amino acid transport system substrate-binding protein
MRPPRLLAPILLAALLGLTGCAGDDSASGTFTPGTPGVLTVATAEVPSAGFWEGTAAHPTGGFEYELAVQLADRFGLDRVRVVTVPFQQIVQGELGGADLALDLVTPTDARDQHLDFSTPYINAPPVIVTPTDAEVPDLAAAQVLRWVSVRGTTLADLLDQQIAPQPPPLVVDTNTAALAALDAGDADAVLLDAPLGFAAAAADDAIHVAAKLGTPEALAAALPDGSDNTEAVDSAIRALIADGTVDDLAERWLGDSAAADAESVPLLRTTR